VGTFTGTRVLRLERTHIPRLIDRLTDARIRAAKPKASAYKLTDGDGLTLLVSEAGTKLWRVRYRHLGRESMLGLGEYPTVSLSAAREKRDEVRRQLANGVNPAGAADTFKAIAEEWLGKQPFSPKTLEKAQWTFNDLLYPGRAHARGCRRSGAGRLREIRRQ